MNSCTWKSTVVAMLLSCAVYAGPRDDAIKEAQALIEQYHERYDQGKYPEALVLIKRALDIRERELGPNHKDTAEALYELGSLYLATGDYIAAGQLGRRALSVEEKTLGSEHPDTANSLTLLGNISYITGNYANAESFYLRSLAIREKTLGPEHPDTARSLIGLGNLYSDIGEYAKAESLYRRALAIREKTFGPDDPATATLLSNMGALYFDTGAYDEAESLFRRVLAIREKALGPDHPDVADSLNNLASLYVERENYAQAEPLFQRTRSIYERTLGAEHPYTAMALGNLSELYFRTHAYDKAEPLQKAAIAIQEKTLGPEHPDLAKSIENLANIYSAIGSYAIAVPLYERARMIGEKALGSRHPIVAEILNSFSICAWRMGDTAKSLKLFERAQSIQAKNIERFLFIGSEAHRREYLRSLSKDAYARISFSVAVPNHRTIELGLTAVLQHKGRVLDVASDSNARLRRSVRATDRAIFEQLTEVTNQLSVLTYRNFSDLSAEEYQRRFDRLSRRQESLEAKLAERSAEFRRQVAPITVYSVQRAIPNESMLIEWLRYRPFDPKARANEPAPRYVAFLVKHNGEPSVVDVGDATQIDDLAYKFRDALSDPSRSDVKEHAIALSDAIMKPLRSRISGARRLLMSPDGALNLIPMSALVDENGAYLAEHVEITYLTSGRDVLRFTGEPHARKSIVVANPDYGQPLQLLARNDSLEPKRSADLDRSGLFFRPLKNTMLEANTLKSLLHVEDANVLTGANAMEANVKQLHGPQILHIATHGFFLPDKELNRTYGAETPSIENPLLRSGIALAGANERRSGANDDGILTALEAAQLDLHGTELVVLSACDSGVGQVQNGEGVYGLRRALILAGAQTEVMSLWKVSDESTSKLMVDYYRRLLSGESRSAALYHAQQTILASSTESHPYYWAAFVSIGNPAPLPLVH